MRGADLAVDERLVGALLVLAHLAIAAPSGPHDAATWAEHAADHAAVELLIGERLMIAGGALGVGGIVSLILGGLLLTSTSNPEFQVSRWLIYGWAAVIGVFFLMIMSTILRMRRMLPAKTGGQALIGRAAVARSPLEPSGQVFLQGERWQATSEDGPVRGGERVIVTGVRGLHLTVRKAPVRQWKKRATCSTRFLPAR